MDRQLQLQMLVTGHSKGTASRSQCFSHRAPGHPRKVSQRLEPQRVKVYSTVHASSRNLSLDHSLARSPACRLAMKHCGCHLGHMLPSSVFTACIQDLVTKYFCVQINAASYAARVFGPYSHSRPRVRQRQGCRRHLVQCTAHSRHPRAHLVLWDHCSATKLMDAIPRATTVPPVAKFWHQHVQRETHQTNRLTSTTKTHSTGACSRISHNLVHVLRLVGHGAHVNHVRTNRARNLCRLGELSRASPVGVVSCRSGVGAFQNTKPGARRER